MLSLVLMLGSCDRGSSSLSPSSTEASVPVTGPNVLSSDARACEQLGHARSWDVNSAPWDFHMARAYWKAVTLDLKRALKVVVHTMYRQAEGRDLARRATQICHALGYPISGDLEAQATPHDAGVCDLLRRVVGLRFAAHHRPWELILDHAVKKSDDFYLYDLADHARWARRGPKMRRFLNDALDRCDELQV